MLKKLFNHLRHYSNVLLNIVVGKKIIYIYQNKYGIKNFNLALVSLLDSPYVIKELEIDSKEIYLGPDFLKDDFTLLGTTIDKSPHLQYMKSLLEGESIDNTCYYVRKRKGILDWRRADHLLINEKYIRDKFNNRYTEIEDNNYNPVYVYTVADKFYIYDGKHRAALCSLLGKKVKCHLISNDCIFSFYGGYLFKIISKDSQYSKHNLFFQNRLKDSNEV